MYNVTICTIRTKDCTIYKKVYKGFDQYSFLYCTTCCTINSKPFLMNCTTFCETFCTILVNVVVQIVQIVRIGTRLQYCTNCTTFCTILSRFGLQMYLLHTKAHLLHIYCIMILAAYFCTGISESGSYQVHISS